MLDVGLQLAGRGRAVKAKVLNIDVAERKINFGLKASYFTEKWDDDKQDDEDDESDSELEAAAGKFDFIISTVNADLNWPAFVNTLAPKGRLHFVGVVPGPVSLAAFPLIAGQRSVSGTPSGGPATMAKMLDFCARHDIAAVTESFKMSEANEAFAHLEAGKARYRIVLENDIKV